MDGGVPKVVEWSAPCDNDIELPVNPNILLVEGETVKRFLGESLLVNSRTTIRRSFPRP